MNDRIALTEAELLDYSAGVLSPESMAALAARLAQDPAGQATLAEWQRQDAAIEALYQPVLHEPVPNRLTNVIRRAEGRRRYTARRPIKRAPSSGRCDGDCLGLWRRSGLACP
jgi:anti-sigma factor RsiW